MRGTRGEQLWEDGQDLVQEEFEGHELNLLPLADLLLHHGWALEKRFL